MDTESIVLIWLCSCWLAGIILVVGWTIWSVKMVTDAEVIQAAQVILNYSDTSRQFELFIKTINASAPSVDTGSPQWLEQASVALGMTKRELLWRLSKQRDERKVS